LPIGVIASARRPSRDSSVSVVGGVWAGVVSIDAKDKTMAMRLARCLRRMLSTNHSEP
jgi:hypothetical protein